MILKININDKKIEKMDFFNFLLNSLENSFFPKPRSVIIGNREIDIDSYMSKRIQNELLKNEFFIVLENNQYKMGINLHRPIEYWCFGMNIDRQFMENIEIQQLKSFFMNIVNEFNPIYASLHDYKHRFRTLKKVYRELNRTFFSPGLFWLNYFNDKELERQGGYKIMNNSYATEIKKIGDGVFIQVNETYFDCLTPEGEERLINATKAMPPVKRMPGTEVQISDVDPYDEFDDEDETEND